MTVKDMEGMNLICCSYFQSGDQEEEKSAKDFFTDLYLFTDDQLDCESTDRFWNTIFSGLKASHCVIQWN
jgi:hypothetical protein